MDALIRYPPHERAQDAVAARHRPRGHRDPDGGGAPAQRGRTDPPGSRPQRLRGAHLEVEGAVGQHHHQPDEADGGLRRLGPRALHHGRGAVRGGAGELRPPLRRRPDLPRQAPRQLGPGPADRGVGPGSRLRRRGRRAVAHPLSARGRRRPPGSGDHAAGDDARRHRGRGPSRRRALPRSRGLDGRAAAHRAAHPPSSPTRWSIPSSGPGASRSPPPTTSTTTRSANATGWNGSTSSRRTRGSATTRRRGIAGWTASRRGRRSSRISRRAASSRAPSRTG